MPPKNTGTVRGLPNKGGRPATGSIKWARNPKLRDPKTGKMGTWQWHARITLDGKRPLIPIDPNIAHDDVERARACALETSEWYRTNPTAPDGVRETLREYAKRWTKAREERGVASVRSDRYRLEHHVLPVLGGLDVRTFTRADVERLRDRLDRAIALREKADGHMSWKSAANIWTIITTMCTDMVSAKRSEFRVRDDNPCRDVKPPDRGAKKAKQYLYPSEFLQFVTCKHVPFSWRRAVALAVYTYARDGELRALRWDGGDIDLAHGVLSITRAYSQSLKRVSQTKTGHTRRVAIEKNLLPLLKVMRKEARGKGNVLTLVVQGEMARTLRRLLKRAGVTRPELHEASPTRKAMTFHDLRATGITWMAVRGDDPLKIKQRAGHTTFQTTEGYIREAEAVRDGFGDVFPALPETVFRRGEVSDWVSVSARGKSRKALFSSDLECERRDLNPSQENAPIAEDLRAPVDDAPASKSETLPTSEGLAGPSTDLASPKAEPPTDSELERGILDAVKVGAFDIARVLSSQLEERRRMRAGNVVPIDAKRRGSH